MDMEEAMNIIIIMVISTLKRISTYLRFSLFVVRCRQSGVSTTRTLYNNTTLSQIIGRRTKNIRLKLYCNAHILY